MYLFENPVLQRELLVNLRMKKAFILQMAYVALLGLMVYFAWPGDEKIDMANSEKSVRLVNLFFLGQYILVGLMTPTFAAGAITGEKERKTYELLLASPLRPAAIVLGKMLASLALLALLMFSSLPIVMLCLPLGGTSIYEVLAVYLALLLATGTFGLVSLYCSMRFQRTAAALVVSYLAILPLALLGLLFWYTMSHGEFVRFRLFVTVAVLPPMCIALWVILILRISNRLLYPPDVGSEGKEVVDEEYEQQHAVGLIIRRDQFPDRLFAPPKRAGLMPDGANPVYDKEMRSEIFSQGTLMLRVVIQVSMFLAIPLMAWCLYLKPQFAPWYIGYVILFNMLVGPVFSAGSVTSERERQTLDLLLTTLIKPKQILFGKLLSGLRVSSVLTGFLLWPLLLACVMVTDYWSNLVTMLGYTAIVFITCLFTATLALFCSVLSRKTSVSLTAAYVVVIVLFMAPLAVQIFAGTFFPDSAGTNLAAEASFVSPVATAFSLPLDLDREGVEARLGQPWVFAKFVVFYGLLTGVLMGSMIWLFGKRWRVAY